MADIMISSLDTEEVKDDNVKSKNTSLIERYQIESVEEVYCISATDQINVDCMNLQSMSTLDMSLQIQDEHDCKRELKESSDLI